MISTRRLSAFLLVALLLLAGSVDPALGQMTQNEHKLAKEWHGQLEEIRADLDEEKWRKARRHADRLLDEMCTMIKSGKGAWRFLALGTLMRAIAHAGAGDMREAQWDWHMTASFDREVAQTNLEEFGAPGRRLAAYRQSLEEREGTRLVATRDVLILGPTPQPGITRPKRKRSPYPDYPWASKVGEVTGPTLVTVIVEKDGRLSSPHLVQTINPAQSYATLDTLRRWRYEPARKDGKPIRLLQSVRVNFFLEGD